MVLLGLQPFVLVVCLSTLIVTFIGHAPHNLCMIDSATIWQTERKYCDVFGKLSHGKGNSVVGKEMTALICGWVVLLNLI